MSWQVIVPVNLAWKALKFVSGTWFLRVGTDWAWSLIVASKWAIVTLWTLVTIISLKAGWVSSASSALADVAWRAINTLSRIILGVHTSAASLASRSNVNVVSIARTVHTVGAWDGKWRSHWAIGTEWTLQVLVGTSVTVETCWARRWCTASRVTIGTGWAFLWVNRALLTEGTGRAKLRHHS